MVGGGGWVVVVVVGGGGAINLRTAFPKGARVAENI